MKSHEYTFPAGALIKLCAWPMAWVAVFAVVVHGLCAVGGLPSPRPTGNFEQAILTHQLEASRTAPQADVVLVGDSSCLMNVLPRVVEEQTGRSVLNLGTLSYMGPAEFARIAAAYLEREQPVCIVLLMHPEALRRAAPLPHYVEIVDAFYEGRPPPARAGMYGRLVEVLGLANLRDRVLDRALPRALPVAYAETYGFTHDLYHIMDENGGHVQAAGRFEAGPGQGHAEYSVSEQVIAAGVRFREAVPQTVKLLAAITPAPDSFVLSGYPAIRDEMLAAWVESMEADIGLADLPATMDDRFFASKTHLNQRGSARFSRQLAAALRAHGLIEQR
jgi:hypothetical protein